MAIELVVPKVGESISEVEIAQWFKKEGEQVERDETVVLLDTAKTTVELPSPVAGTIGKILKQEGDAAAIGEVLAVIEEGDAASSANGATASAATTPAPQAASDTTVPTATTQAPTANGSHNGAGIVMPAAGRVLAQNNVQPDEVHASGPSGRLLKEDVLRHLQNQPSKPDEKTGTIEGMPETSVIERPAPTQPDGKSAQPVSPAPKSVGAVSAVAPPAPTEQPIGAGEEVVKMNMMRREIARRLVEAQQTAALLTTFNEIDMAPVMALRKEHQEAFQKKYGIKLWLHVVFVKAAIDALKQFPAINAEIRGNDIVYRNYFDMGVAIGSGKGLVVPVLRRAELLSFAQVESSIADLAKRAQAGSLKPEELEGGTFTITNGGIYGSLLSTPIVNPPQSGILGMHSIQERPVARDGQVVIRPMMYVALTYDHRLVDGREAVSFLVRVKECIENPARMLLEV